MCGIFAYCVYDQNGSLGLTSAKMLEILQTGISRMGYLGYDSCGVCVGSSANDSGTNPPVIIKTDGVAEDLAGKVKASLDAGTLAGSMQLTRQVGLAHNRWATHGDVSEANAHPHSSDPKAQFVVVHNGIVENHRHLRQYLSSPEGGNFHFKTETDSEVVAALALHLWQKNENPTVDFRSLVEQVACQLQGAFALAFKSPHYPGECVVTCRGSPLVLGLKGVKHMDTDAVAVSTRRNAFVNIGDCDSRSLWKTGPFNNPELFSEARPKCDEPLEIRGDSLVRISSSPGIGGDPNSPSQFIFASDQCALVEVADRCVHLNDDDVVHVDGKGRLEIHQCGMTACERATGESSGPGTPIYREIQTLSQAREEVILDGYSHYMEKEIHEQPESLRNALRGRIHVIPRTDKKLFDECLWKKWLKKDQEPLRLKMGGMEKYYNEISVCQNILVIAEWSSYHAALAHKVLLTEMSPRAVVLVFEASDFLYCTPVIHRSDVCVFVSQLGEDREIVRALQYCDRRRAITVGITNVVGSSVSRMTMCGSHVRAGPEFGLCSTKMYTSQFIALTMLATYLGSNNIDKMQRTQQVLESLRVLPDLVTRTLLLTDQMKDLARYLLDRLPAGPFYFAGRGTHFATCREAAFIINEITNLPCTPLDARVDRGPLAVLAPGTPVLFFISRERPYEDRPFAPGEEDAGRKLHRTSLDAFTQLSDRGLELIVICEDGDADIDDARFRTVRVPVTDRSQQGILNIIPLQLLAYHMGVALNRNVDQDRSPAQAAVAGPQS